MKIGVNEMFCFVLVCKILFNSLHVERARDYIRYNDVIKKWIPYGATENQERRRRQFSFIKRVLQMFLFETIDGRFVV